MWAPENVGLLWRNWDADRALIASLLSCRRGAADPSRHKGPERLGANRPYGRCEALSSPRDFCALSTMWRLMARQQVAAGEGALSTWMEFLPSTMLKS